MEFSKLSSPSLKDLFIREIENLILSGQLNIGDQLPSERELADKMEVSRAVVTSGLSALAGRGFVEIKPRLGVFVADYKRKGTVETLLAILRYSGGILKKEEIRSLLEIRLAFETLAIELATPRMTGEHLMILKELIFDFEESQTASEMAEGIFLIHHEICIISENSLLPVIFYSFKELSIQLWHRYFLQYGKDALLKNTTELYSFFENGEVQSAVSTFQDSLKKTINGVISIYNK